MKNKKGFTLAELTITLALVAIIVVSVMTLTATTYKKNYNSRISFLYQNECQNLMNCYIASKFNLVGDDYISEEFEKNLDFLYELESEDENVYKSHDFVTVGSDYVEYEIYYDEFFNFTENYSETTYIITCKLDYTASVNTLSIKVSYAENNDVIDEYVNIIQKGMGV